MLVRLTNAKAGDQGKPLAINPAHVVAVYQVFDTERRIDTVTGEQYIVEESYDAILTAFAAA